VILEQQNDGKIKLSGNSKTEDKQSWLTDITTNTPQIVAESAAEKLRELLYSRYCSFAEARPHLSIFTKYISINVHFRTHF